MRWFVAFLLGMAWFALHVITNSDYSFIVANIWIATAYIIASK